MTPSTDTRVSAAELLETIRETVNEWHAIYHRDTGESVRSPYLSTLANDIAHELGIMEAVDAELKARAASS
jgi:hypothetical protein